MAPLSDPKPLTGAEDDYDDLIDLIGGARVVLLGEASHGTFEFYRERAFITRRGLRRDRRGRNRPGSAAFVILNRFMMRR